LLVPVDVGKHEAMALLADATNEHLVASFTFTLNWPHLAQMVERVAGARSEIQVKATVRYHQPVTASSILPSHWMLIKLNPAHVTEQPRVLGNRGIKADQIDLAAMFDLLFVARGLVPAPKGYSSRRRGRRCVTGTALR
jgi:hypothetical protein